MFMPVQCFAPFVLTVVRAVLFGGLPGHNLALDSSFLYSVL